MTPGDEVMARWLISDFLERPDDPDEKCLRCRLPLSGEPAHPAMSPTPICENGFLCKRCQPGIRHLDPSPVYTPIERSPTEDERLSRDIPGWEYREDAAEVVDRMKARARERHLKSVIHHEFGGRDGVIDPKEPVPGTYGHALMQLAVAMNDLWRLAMAPVFRFIRWVMRWDR